MAYIDGTAVNIALPILQEELTATVSELQWFVESYALFLAALMLVGGMLGDRFGHRRVFVIGLALFTAASVSCGLAQSAPQLIGARAAQGVGGAMLVPGSLALISANFSRDQRGRAIGTWSAFTALAMAAGPVLGGLLIDNVSWRWVFFINVPLAGVALAILYHGVPESRDDTREVKLDGWGAALATVGLGAVVFGLIESANRGFDDEAVLGALAVGALALAAFVVVEARSQAPMMPLELFRSRTFSGANLVTLLLYAALGGSLFFLPLNLIQVQGYSATAAGLAILPLIVIVFLLSRWSGGLADRFGARLPLTVGPAIAGLGYALFAVPSLGGGYWETFFAPVAVLGLGMAISVAPLTTVVMAEVEVHRAGIASGINNAVSRIAGVLAIAVFGLFVVMTFNSSLDDHLTNLELPAGVRTHVDEQRIKLAGAEPPAGLGGAARDALEWAIGDAFVSGFRLVMLIAAALALASALVAWLTIEGKPRTGR
jgi:EmrB/QacA subfamily drug resistance transporter